MKAVILSALIASTGLVAFGQDSMPPAQASSPDASEKQRIAVLPLRGTHAGLMQDQGDTVYQKITAQFLRLKRFDIIERAQMGALLAEGKLQSSGLVDDSTAVALGKQLGVHFVILGSWSGAMQQAVSSYRDAQGNLNTSVSFPGYISVSLRMVDVQTGRIKATFEAKGAPMAPITPGDSLTSMLKDFDKKLDRCVSNEFPLIGTVLKVINEKEAIIDLGSNDGVKEDDPFALVVRGEDMVHPKTGRIIKGEKKVLAELKVTGVEPDKAFVKITKSMSDDVHLKPGMDLESQPKKASFWEKAGDSLLRR